MKPFIQWVAFAAFFSGALLCANAQTTMADTNAAAPSSNPSAMTVQCNCSNGMCSSCNHCSCNKHFYASAGGGYLFKNKSFNGGGFASGRVGWVFAKKWHGLHSLEAELSGAWTKGNANASTSYVASSTPAVWNSQLSAKMTQVLLMFNYRFTTKLGRRGSPWLLSFGGGIGSDFTDIKISQVGAVTGAPATVVNQSRTQHKTYFAGQLFATIGYGFKLGEFPAGISVGARLLLNQQIKALGFSNTLPTTPASSSAAPQATTNVANAIIEGSFGFAF